MHPENSNDRRDITVVGAGIVGICTALALQERQFNVTVIDRLPPAEACSHGNAGIFSAWSVPESLPGQWKNIPKWLIDPKGPVFVRPSYIPKLVPWIIRFLRAAEPSRVSHLTDAMKAINTPAYEMYRELLAGSGHEDLIRESSYLYLYRHREQLNPDALGYRLRRQMGAELEVLDGPALRKIEPTVSKDYEAAMKISPQGHTVNPGKLGKVLAQRVERQGGRFERNDVHGIKALEDGSFELTLEDGVINTPRIAITAGAWSHRLTRQLGCDMPLEAERGYHAILPNPGVETNNPMAEATHQFAMTSMEMGLRVAGTVEFAGVDAKPEYDRARMLIKLAKQVLPDLNTSDPELWMGPRPAFPDTIPVISALPGHANAFVGCGHSHLGLTGGPMTGQLIAAMADGDRIDVDPEPFRADRF